MGEGFTERTGFMLSSSRLLCENLTFFSGGTWRQEMKQNEKCLCAAKKKKKKRNARSGGGIKRLLLESFSCTENLNDKT